jgi:multimeric flavodoxin WrbA
MLIISASNVSLSKGSSQSIVMAQRIKDGLARVCQQQISIIDLRDYQIDFCVMCEKCGTTQTCARDDDFNKFHDAWKGNNEIALIIPHYALIPAKLLAVLEKIQEIMYLSSCLGKEITEKKKAIIIGHGGLTENYVETYEKDLINPMTALLQNMGCEVLNKKTSMPLCLGVKKYLTEKESNGICYKKENDEITSQEIINEAIRVLAVEMTNGTDAHNGWLEDTDGLYN